MEAPNPVDASIKVLLRRHPGALFRLSGLSVELHVAGLEDTSINLAEQRADHVFIIGEPDDPARKGLYLEYQLRPDSRDLPDWFSKCGALGKQLGIPVLLLVVYLERGNRARFPASYGVTLGPFKNTFEFATVRLWEHVDRIRSGELWELAPLLVLCEDTPTEQTVRQEVELIRGSGAPLEEQGGLLALALRIGTRDFARDVLEAIFREELPAMQGASIIDDWITEGEARGEARGRTEEARRLTLRLLRKRFGELPSALAARIKGADAAWCEALLERALEVESLEELAPS
jgi:predicted transposase YdaD